MSVISALRAWRNLIRDPRTRAHRFVTAIALACGLSFGCAFASYAADLSDQAGTSARTLPGFEYDVPLRADEPPHVDLIRVDKSERRLDLVGQGVVVASYSIALGREPSGPKQRQGDGRTPEGRYRIDWRKTDSDYHRALHISYPNAEDVARARQQGVDPGGAIMIHGLPNGLGFVGVTHTLVDWTDGCIAVTDREIEEIWEWVDDGVEIEILP